MSRVREKDEQDDQAGLPKGAERAAFVTRLREIVRHWPSADRLARAVGVSPSAFRKWLRGEAEPSRERLVALADAARVPIAWLAKGEGSTPRLEQTQASRGAAQHAQDSEIFGPDSFLILPKRILAAAAGNEPPPPLPTAEYIAFRHDWIRAALKIPPDLLGMEVAVGESMEPTIRDGDLLLVDTTEQSVGAYGIYVLELNGERLVKRVQKKVDGTLLLISDNPAYEPDHVPPDVAETVTVVGRVVWTGGML